MLAMSESGITDALVMTDSPGSVFAASSLTPGPWGAVRGRARHPAALPGDPIHTRTVPRRFGAAVRRGGKASG
jgi:hypothetical protein